MDASVRSGIMVCMLRAEPPWQKPGPEFRSRKRTRLLQERL